MATRSEPKQTLEQRRARHAWETVQSVQKGGGDPKVFGKQAKGLPTRIISAGLGPALAFLRAKKYALELQEALSNWIAQQVPPARGQSQDLLQRIVYGSSDFLRRATDEALAYLVWLNRFAEAEGLTDDTDS